MLKHVPGWIFCGASAICLAHGRSFILPGTNGKASSMNEMLWSNGPVHCCSRCTLMKAANGHSSLVDQLHARYRGPSLTFKKKRIRHIMLFVLCWLSYVFVGTEPHCTHRQESIMAYWPISACVDLRSSENGTNGHCLGCQKRNIIWHNRLTMDIFCRPSPSPFSNSARNCDL